MKKGTKYIFFFFLLKSNNDKKNMSGRNIADDDDKESLKINNKISTHNARSSFLFLSSPFGCCCK